MATNAGFSVIALLPLVKRGGGSSVVSWGAIRGDIQRQTDLIAYVEEEVGKLSGKVMKFKGFVSLTQPTGVITEGSYWYESATLPEEFPISVKTYESGEWSTDTTSYSPETLDLWSYNDGKGYYWFGNVWNKLDENLEADDITLENDEGVLKFKIKTSADKNKVWKVKADGTWELKNINEWKIVEDFDDEELNDYTLYILIVDTTFEGTDYKKGFYTWDSVNGLVARSSEVEIDEKSIVLNSDDKLQANAIIDLGNNDFPTTNILTKTYYRKNQTVSYVVEEVSKSFTMTKMFLYENGNWVSHSEITLTEEEYDNLPESMKIDNTTYIVKGAGSLVTQWIYRTLQGLPTIAGITIVGDLTLENINVYSRDEILQLLEGKSGTEYVDYLPSTMVKLTWYFSKHYKDGTEVENNKRAWYVLDKNNILQDMGIVGESDLSKYQTKNDNNLQTTNKTIVGAINENKERIDNIPTLYEKINTVDPLQGDRCIFDFYKKDNTPFTRIVQKQVFNSYIPEIIAGGSTWGTLEVTEMVKSNGVCFIIQEFTEWMGTTNQSLKRFIRKGIATGITDPYTQITSATITWQSWKPIDYPNTLITGDCRYNIKGGMVYVAIVGNFTPSGTGDIGSLFTLPSAIRPSMEIHGTVRNFYGQTGGEAQTIWVGTNGVVNCWRTGYNWSNVRGNLIYLVNY